MIDATERTLHERLAAQEAAHAALRADHTALLARLAVAKSRRARRQPRRLVPLALLALLVALVPASILAANPFGDLNGGSVHNANIDAIYVAGVTKGCDPDVAYCPNGLVTREEMASFLARLGGLGANPPIARALSATTAETATNATTANSATTAQTATSATTANSATTAQTAAKLAANPAGATTYAANDLVRVAGAVGVNSLDVEPQTPLTITGVYVSPAGANTYDTLVTLTITAPTAGLVMVTGNAIIAYPIGTLAVLRLRDTTPGAPTTAVSPLMGEGPEDTVSNRALSQSFAFPVGPGPRTFVLEVSSSGATGTAQAGNGTMTAIFAPFGPTGAQP